MGYKKGKEPRKPLFLSRIKDLTTLVVGSEYHVRKVLSREGMTVKDDAHDIILKECKDGKLISNDDKEFLTSEYEVFIRKG